MFVADTNLLVYAADEESPYHERCHELVLQWRRLSNAWYLTWGIVYEFLRVTTHPRVFRHPWNVRQAWSFVESLLASRYLGILCPTERHAETAANVIGQIPHLHGNMMHDAHTAVLMLEHGIKTIYTHDTDFHRFPFLQIVDPLGPERP